VSPYPPALLARIAGLCEAEPGREACGLVIRRGASLEAIEIPNVATDPTGAFLMEPAALLRILADLDATRGAVLAVWHSHVEQGAYLSARDRADAVAGGVQQVPGADYLVLGLRAGRVAEARRFRWDGRGFVEAELASGAWTPDPRRARRAP
jgi:proteasome lid subunit RPN8/RPN11